MLLPMNSRRSPSLFLLLFFVLNDPSEIYRHAEKEERSLIRYLLSFQHRNKREQERKKFGIFCCMMSLLTVKLDSFFSIHRRRTRKRQKMRLRHLGELKGNRLALEFQGGGKFETQTPFSKFWSNSHLRAPLLCHISHQSITNRVVSR